MTRRKQTIAILWHEHQRRLGFRYMILDYAEVWKADGHEVISLFGPRQYKPADVLIVHVDLSVVPEPYLEFATRFPVALNGNVRDIRKSKVSRLRVGPEDAWAGPVLVKSDLNTAGFPDAVLGANVAAVRRIRTPQDYRVYDSLQQVPADVWRDDSVVVERFVPEREGDQYVIRTMVFLGDRATCSKSWGPHPIVHGTTQTHTEWVDPHAEVLALRGALGFDMGKFDYVLHQGQPILLDTNKTVGRGSCRMTPERLNMRRKRAEGLYAYFTNP